MIIQTYRNKENELRLILKDVKEKKMNLEDSIIIFY